ncbi:hypothetical protein [Streptomyces sp. NPDC048277]|uniref:LGFP repeat-containing protein n=1 Tax=Streptomyces sp. NPDC048277 TaxID=3155027 RepID=UPI003408DC29
MRTLNRRLLGGALGSLLALGGLAAVPAAAHTAATTARGTSARLCYGGHPIANNFIYRRWKDLGGSGGYLGCPTGDNRRLSNGAERQSFQNGQLAWSPDQGHRMVVAAFEYNGRAYFNWGPTDPFHYDRFLVRWTSAADPYGTQRELTGGNSGWKSVVKETSGAYTFTVEGCDLGSFGHTCRQGWTVPVTTD